MEDLRDLKNLTMHDRARMAHIRQSRPDCQVKVHASLGSPLGPLGFKCSQHSPTTLPSVERTAEKAYSLSDRVQLSSGSSTSGVPWRLPSEEETTEKVGRSFHIRACVGWTPEPPVVGVMAEGVHFRAKKEQPKRVFKVFYLSAKAIIWHRLF